MSRDDEGLEPKDREISDDEAGLDIEVSSPADYRPPVRVPPNSPDPEEPAPTQQATGASS
jgi:hypothetical protein